MITDKELIAMREDALLVEYPNRGKVKVSGEDHLTFLHSLLTNDITGLSEGSFCQAALLNAQSKILMHMWVFRFNDFVILDVEAEMAANTIELLNRFVITENVVLENMTGKYSHFSSFGPKSVTYLKKALLDLPAITVNQFLTIDINESPIVLSNHESKNGQRFDFWIESGKPFDLRKLSGAQQVSFEASEALRIKSGIPRYGVEMTEETMLSETGLEEITVSETKGCYPGQEVVAKIKTYGGLNKKLVKFSFEESIPPIAKDRIYSSGAEVGWVASAVLLPPATKGVGLAYLKRGHFENSSKLTVQSSREIEIQTTPIH